MRSSLPLAALMLLGSVTPSKRPGIPDNVFSARSKRRGLNLWPEHRPTRTIQVWRRELGSVGPRGQCKLVTLQVPPPSPYGLTTEGKPTRQGRRAVERMNAKGVLDMKRHRNGALQRVYTVGA